VGYGTRIVIEGTGVLGSVREHTSRFPARLGPTSPAVRVRAAALLGSVEVGRIETAEDTARRRQVDGGT
jgi:hypothetical protein